MEADRSGRSFWNYHDDDDDDYRDNDYGDEGRSCFRLDYQDIADSHLENDEEEDVEKGAKAGEE